MPGNIPLEVRNLRFDIGARTPRNWQGKSQSVTTFMNNLSILFPVGERFFIHTVRAYRDVVAKDPKLAADVKGFCAQEGMHGREHVRYNEMVKAQGYPVDELEAFVAKLLEQVQTRLPPRMQLAATCALEHFTALMAQFILEDPRVLEGADPEMARLWRWHAAEENEHKGVAFDVYRAAGGTETERIAVMVLASTIFWAVVAKQQVQLMRADGIALSVHEWAQLFDFFFGEPGWMLTLAKPYASYFRPGFHPWDHDSRPMLERWKAEHEAYVARTAS